MTAKYAVFDAADYLDNDAIIAEYLSAAVEDPNPDVFLAALGDAGHTLGVALSDRNAGINPASLEF